MKKYLQSGVLLLLVVVINSCGTIDIENVDWKNYGGNAAGNRYSASDQINLSNVKDLKVAWMYNAAEDPAENKAGRPLEIECQPIVVNGILYGTTPLLKLFALDAATGNQLWKFNPFAGREPRPNSNRGVVYWESGNDKRIIYTAGSHIYAVNVATGKLVQSFGDSGRVDLHAGLGDKLDHDISKLAVTATSPGVIYKNTLVLGSKVSEGGDAAPGHVRGFDVITGKLKWIFHTIPQPGETGYDTWPPDAYKKMGGANNWGGMVLDEKRGVVYFGTGSPSVDFYGARRPGKNLFSDCILALDAETGKLKWWFQTIYHDLWDRDIPCPPNLITVTHNGKKVDALVQTTKDGLVYVLNRDNGESLFPIEERKVPVDSALPGEQPWPVQKFPVKPKPFSRQVFTEDDITDITPEAHAFVKAKFLQSRSGNKFLPPSVEGSLFFGFGGGAEWGGNAADSNGILYVNSNEMLWNLKMTDIATWSKERSSKGQSLYLTNCATCHGPDRKGSGQEFPSLVNIAGKLNDSGIHAIVRMGRGRMPAFANINDGDRNAIINFLLKSSNSISKSSTDDVHDNTKSLVGAQTEKKDSFPYVPGYINNGYTRFFDPNGYPAVKPPWGTLNAIDLNTGDYLWTVPLGEFPELTKKGVPVTGTENYGGPVVTAGGLVFIAATKDERIRAFDKTNGKIVWEYQLPAGGFATPITYKAGGKQFIVIAAGGAKNGHKPGGNYIAFALP